MNGKDLQLGMTIKHNGMRHIADREITAIGRKNYLYIVTAGNEVVEQADTFAKLRDWEIKDYGSSINSYHNCKCSKPLNCS